MTNFDLIPDIDNLETLFIMESPHIKELETGIPCSGTTGIRMSVAIFDNSNVAFGKILSTKQDYTLKYGIMNSFPFALGLTSQLPIEQQPFTKIKNINYTTRNEFYKQHLNLLRKIGNVEEHTQFKARLINYINNAPNLKHLVFCGYISQAMYLYSFNQAVLPYNKLTLLKTKREKETYIIFVNHPSEKNEVWDFKLSNLS